jgi:hypothetical protein
LTDWSGTQDCGGSHFKEQGIRDTLKARLPGHPEIDNMTFGAFDK